ncbi:kinase-like protein [Melanomma pulvis-pyrius CBS 109.77]|uniref:EKC/KEOPS complex subunit BUD32 n=1 Tax=Melanomma pulvis-pyrius CBS 109.77 TaxID=1314802 RepID=A0A6A6XM41_9PLEO|nr:kinase-like protein [Melanomma pulvis-pyrius CBS 109.77]
MEENDTRTEVRFRLQLLKEVLPIFIAALSMTSENDFRTLALGMLKAFGTQLGRIDALMMPGELRQVALQHSQKTSQLAHELLTHLENRLHDNVSKEYPLLHLTNYPKLTAVRHLLSRWSKEVLAAYVDFGSMNELPGILIEMISGINLVLVGIADISSTPDKSRQPGAEQDESIETTLLEEVRLAQKFCESSTQLFKFISKRIRCSAEHKIHVHLSGFGRDNCNIELLFHTCIGSEIYPGGYPVSFCKPGCVISPSDEVSDICRHVQKVRNFLKPVKMYFNEAQIRAAGTARIPAICREDIVDSFDRIIDLIKQKPDPNLLEAPIFPEAHRRRLQCLLAQSLLYLYPSPWLQNMCDLENLEVQRPGVQGGLKKPYTLCTVSPTAYSKNNGSPDFDETLYLRVFMAKFGLLLLRIQFQQSLELSADEMNREEGYEMALLRYIKQLNVDLNTPLPIQRAVNACRDFPQIIEESCSPLLRDENIKCRLTILKEILNPLTTDLLDTFRSVSEESPHLIITRKLEEKWKDIQNSTEEAFSELEALKQETVHPYKGVWVPKYELQKAWENIGLEKFFELRGITLSKQECELIKTTYLSLVSTLVTIKWHEWWRFRDLFLEDKDEHFKDSQLPIRDKSILDQYLDPQDASLFWKMQHEYIHIMLPDCECKRLLPNSNLPYLKSKQRRLGGDVNDGCGVYNETIPPLSLKFTKGGYNDTYLMVARKVINDYTMNNEEKVASLLRNSIIKHEGVVDILSMYRRDGFLDIVYPLASADLEKFMTHEMYDDYWTHTSAISRLLLAIRHLASGLKFLHDGTEDPIRRSSILCHMDFRPKNILVYLKESATGLVGFELKICDFGIAKMQPKPDHVPLVLLPTANLLGFAQTKHSKSGARRFAGTYQAPEMHYNPDQVGRKSDVWSLASISIRIFIRQIFGLEELERFDERRADLNESEDFFFSDTDPDILNDAVDAWLNDLSNPNSELSSRMVARLNSQTGIRLKDIKNIPGKISAILRKALEIKAEERSSSEEMHGALMNLWY